MNIKHVPIFIIFLVNLCFSQNKQILYGFSEIPQSLLSNPGGNINNKAYFGIPLLSHFHFNVGSSGISAYDIFADDGRDFNAKLRSAVNNLKPTDFFTATQQLEIFSGGFSYGDSYNKNKYISFGMYQEFDFINYFPKDYAALALEGNQNNIGLPFDLGHFNFNADFLTVLHVGFNKKVNDKFTYGFRGKLYSSIANISSTKNEGQFLTVPGQNNIYTHFIDANLEAKTSGIASLIDDENSDVSQDIKIFRKRFLFGGNLGLGVDLGFTYKFNDQLTFDGSLLDFGFISHSKDIKKYQIKGNVQFEGANPLLVETGQSANEFWDDIEEDFTDLFDVKESTTKYTRMRPLKLNASLNYAFGEKNSQDCNCTVGGGNYLNRIGGQLYTIARPKGPQLAFTTYYYRHFFNFLRVKATYTVDSYSFNNIGLGISTHFGGFNFYLMADNFLQYKNIYDIRSASLQFGFNYIFKNEN